MQADSQVVTGKCGGVRTVISVARDQGEDAEGAAELGLAEGSGFGFAEGAEFAGAAFDGGAGNIVRKRGGFRSGALGKRKNVEIGEGQAFDEGPGNGLETRREMGGFGSGAGDGWTAHAGTWG